MTSLLLLCGCGSTEQLEDKFDDWRSSFLEQPVHDISAEITSLIGDVHGQYTLAYHRDETEETIEVIEPELIANVKAHITDDNARLSFDGVMLETGTGIGQKLSPLTALPVFMEFLEKGFVKNIWTEKSDGLTLVVTELELADASRMTLWQNKTDMAPLFAAIRSGSAVDIKINLTNVSR